MQTVDISLHSVNDDVVERFYCQKSTIGIMVFMYSGDGYLLSCKYCLFHRCLTTRDAHIGSCCSGQ
jgi:hypothetical protein